MESVPNKMTHIKAVFVGKVQLRTFLPDLNRGGNPYNLSDLIVHKPNPDFGRNPKMACTQYFLVFPNNFEGVL